MVDQCIFQKQTSKLYISWSLKEPCQNLVISCYNSSLGFEKCTFLSTHGNRWPSGNDAINTFHLFKVSHWCFTYTNLWRNHFILVLQVPCVLSGIFKKISRSWEGEHPLGYVILEKTIISKFCHVWKRTWEFL